jgi:acetyl esterase/lipase
MKFLPRPIDLLNITTPRHRLRVVHNIAYGPSERHRLDLYGPRDASAPLPAIAFFHGGSWQSGVKEDYAFVGASLARAGLLVAVPNYRLYPNVQYPAFINDAARATTWLARHAADHGGDPDAIFVSGHSAGAYLALMLALGTEYLGNAGFDRMRLAGAIGLAGPYDFLPLRDRALKAVFATAGDLAATQPISFANAATSPILLLTGAKDRGVGPRNTAVLAARLRAHGNAVETQVYPGIGHAGLLLSLLSWQRYRAPAFRDIMRFITAALEGGFDAGGLPVARDMAG